MCLNANLWALTTRRRSIKDSSGIVCATVRIGASRASTHQPPCAHACNALCNARHLDLTWISAARTPEAIMQMPAGRWRSLELAACSWAWTRTSRSRRASTGRVEAVGAQEGTRLTAGDIVADSLWQPPLLATVVAPGPGARFALLEESNAVGTSQKVRKSALRPPLMGSREGCPSLYLLMRLM